MYRQNLTFGQLIEAMHAATKNFEFYAQRDTMLDIADLAEAQNDHKADDFSKVWHICENGTHLANALSEYHANTAEALYEIRHCANGEWIIRGI